MKIRPKEILAMAREAEKKGDSVVAATGYLRLGQYLLQKKGAEPAHKYIRQGLKLHPSSVRGNYLSALTESFLGNELKAIAAAARFAKEASRKKKISDYRPRIERDFAKYPAARRAIYDCLLTLDRTDPEIFLLAARSAIQAGDLIAARAVALGLLKAGLNDREAARVLKEVLSGLKNENGLEFLQSFEKGRMLKDDLIRLLEAPPSGVSHSGAGDAVDGGQERALGDLISELEAELGLDEGYDKVEPLLAEFRLRSQPVLAGDSKARIDMATAYFGMGLYDAAQSELQHVNATDPRYLEAHCLRGEIFLARGLLLEALEVYQRCRRDERATHPVREEAEYRMIHIHVRLGDRAGAISHLRNLEAMNPDYRDLRTLRESVLGVTENPLPKAAKARG